MIRRAIAPVVATLLAIASPAAGQASGAGIPMSPQLAHGSRAGQAQVPFPVRARVAPTPARVGQVLSYQGSVLVPYGTPVRFEPPAAGGEFTWGTPRAGRQESHARYSGWVAESVWVRIPVQVFASGRVSIPGPRFRLGAPPQTRISRLPTLHIVVQSTITAADSNAQLRPVRGPLAAPWWERVPWRWVVAAIVLLAAVAWAVGWLRRRRRRVAPVVAPVVSAPRRSPADEALAALARLRAEGLPGVGRFGEHAFELTRILRRYLESIVGTPRPGDTSGELVARLRASTLHPDDVRQLEGLLGVWDRVKFARAPLTVPEAERAEQAVEAFIRRGAPDRTREVA